MIHYLVTAAHRYTIDKLLEARAGALPVMIEPVTYEEAFRGRHFSSGTFIFTDLERLTVEDQERAAKVWSTLARAGRRIRLLNHPIDVMRRYELLRELFERGINDFNVYRLNEARRPQRYPVFIRSEDDHRGSQTILLRSAADLDGAIAEMAALGRSRDSRLIVEFHAAADDRGYFRVYGAQCIGGTVIPRSLVFGKHWVVKRTSVELDEDLLAKEREFLATNPHQDFVRRIFEIARIDYGRMDYTVVGGCLQVYEINTNPVLHYRNASVRHATHFPDLPSSVDRMVAALAALDGPSAEAAGAARSTAEG